MTNPPISRRSFLKVSAAGTAAMPFIGVANTAPISLILSCWRACSPV